MKKLLLLVTVLGTLVAQDIAGNYRVSALDVQYYDIARQDTDINVQDAYGFGIELTLLTIYAGDLFYGTHSGPYNEATLAQVGINLNVNFNEDGSASLAEGSFYPDVNEENCVSSVQVLPITDDMVYSSDLTALSPLPTTNMVGLPSISGRAGQLAGGLSLDEALVFDYFPQGWLGYANQFGPDASYMTGDELAPVTLPVDINDPATGGVLLPSGAHLPGVHGGWVNVGDLGPSLIPTSDVDPDLYAEWHAIDGPASESGLGDFIGEDEDGYDGDFDRTFGLPVLPTATYLTGNCSEQLGIPNNLGSTPVAGDITEVIYGGVYAQAMPICEAAGSPVAATTGLCTDASQSDDFAGACAALGGAEALVGTCLQLGFDLETCSAAGVQGMMAVDAFCAYASGGAAADCASAGVDPCSVLTDVDFASELCLTIATGLTESTTCEEWSDGLAQTATDDCVAGVDPATSVFVMDPTGAAAAYGNFVTFNGVAASQGAEGCAAAGLDIESCIAAGAFDPAWLVDDSGHEFDGTSGRLLFNFAPTCIPEIEVRQVVIEAVELGGECLANGDANEDGNVNVLDVVQIVQAILGNGTLTDGGACNSDFNSDGNLNVLDVVSIVQSILGNRSVSANSVEVIKSSNALSFEADGYVGAIQMTINHGNDFSIEMTDKAMVADYRTEGNSTTLMVVNPESNELFIAEGSYTIETVVAAANGEYIDISVPTVFSVSNAYPNPFNPTTSLNINLDTDSFVSVKVFNVMGQLIDTVSEGQMSEGTHAITWDASTLASGVYFINTEVGTSLSSQKVMLLK